MRLHPVPMPDGALAGALTVDPTARTVVVAPPDGDMTNPDIRSVEVLTWTNPESGPWVTIALESEFGDRVWYSIQAAHLDVFSFDLDPTALS